MRVSPMEARSTQALAWTSTASSRTAGPDWRILVPGGRWRGLGEAEAVGADDGAVLQDDVVAELAVLADDGVGVGEEVVADVSVG